MTQHSKIEQVLARWALGYDEGDAAMMEACFTEDAEMRMEIGKRDGTQDVMGPYVGRAEVMGLFTDHQHQQSDQRRHVISNVVIEDDRRVEASVVSYLSLFVTDEKGTRLQATGVYRDELVEQAGEWRIRKRFLHLDSRY
jgi:3-phenylpropionate/cinnamic acid dioxygenase small subunit